MGRLRSWGACTPLERAPWRRVALSFLSAGAVSSAAPRAAGESGGRSDVRWVALQGEGGEGLLALAPAGAAMQVSASPYSLESFEKARHDHELQVCALVCCWFHGLRYVRGTALLLFVSWAGAQGRVCLAPVGTKETLYSRFRRRATPTRTCTWTRRTWGLAGTTAGARPVSLPSACCVHCAAVPWP